MNSNNGFWIGLVILIILVVGGYFIFASQAPATSGDVTQGTDVTGDTTDTSGTPAATPSKPTLTTNPTPIVSNSTALVNGAVTPNGSQTTYWYEYGKTSALGGSTAPQTTGSGYLSIAAPAYIKGLSPSTTYYFRLVGSNAAGTVSGQVYTFTTDTTPPPVVATPAVSSAEATNVTRTGATVGGLVTANGVPTSYWFEYGTKADLGSTTPLTVAGSGTGVQNVTAPLTNLKPATKYFYRLNAENKFGTVNGSILSFTTAK